MLKDILPEFQDFLSANTEVSSANIPFYAYWVNRFLTFTNKYSDFSVEELAEKFIYQLYMSNVEDWKIKQAESAIDLYRKHFIFGDQKLSVDLSVKGQFREQSLLLKKARELIRIRHYSYSTERAYLDWIKRFLGYLVNAGQRKGSLQNLNSQDLTDYLSYLALDRKVSSSTQNQAFNALLFLFRDVLGIDVGDLDKAVRAKRGAKIPVVLTPQEVEKIFSCIKEESRLSLELIYGSGLRLMEALRLRVQDVDFDNNVVFVRSSKGDKDRITVLAKRVKKSLKKHLAGVRRIHEKDAKSGAGEVYLPDALMRKYPAAAYEWKWQYVFPSSKLSIDPRSGRLRRHHIDPTSIQKAVRNAVREAGITKNATVHTLRHSFATHLLMNGVNIREIQDLLGHKNVETTMIYIHVLRNMSSIPRSPLDNLYEKNKTRK